MSGAQRYLHPALGSSAGTLGSQREVERAREKTSVLSRKVVHVGVRVPVCQANNGTGSWNQVLCAHYVTGRCFLTASRLRLTTSLE